MLPSRVSLPVLSVLRLHLGLPSFPTLWLQTQSLLSWKIQYEKILHYSVWQWIPNFPWAVRKWKGFFYLCIKTKQHLDFMKPTFSPLPLRFFTITFWNREQKQQHLRQFNFKYAMATVSNFSCPRKLTHVIFKYCSSLWGFQCVFLTYFKHLFALKAIMRTFHEQISLVIAIHSVHSHAGWDRKTFCIERLHFTHSTFVKMAFLSTKIVSLTVASLHTYISYNKEGKIVTF